MFTYCNTDTPLLQDFRIFTAENYLLKDDVKKQTFIDVESPSREDESLHIVLGYIFNECEIFSDKDITSYNDNTEKEELTHEFIDYVSDFNHLE